MDAGEESLIQRAMREFNRMYFIPLDRTCTYEMLDEHHVLCMCLDADVLAGLMSEDGSWIISSCKTTDQARKHMKEELVGNKR